MVSLNLLGQVSLHAYVTQNVPVVLCDFSHQSYGFHWKHTLFVDSIFVWQIQQSAVSTKQQWQFLTPRSSSWESLKTHQESGFNSHRSGAFGMKSELLLIAPSCSEGRLSGLDPPPCFKCKKQARADRSDSVMTPQWFFLKPSLHQSISVSSQSFKMTTFLCPLFILSSPSFLCLI